MFINKQMKSLLFLTTFTAAISACVDPYSVLGISANDSDKRIIEATRDLVIFYKKDPFAHDIMLSALQEIMTARGRPIGSFVRILNCPQTFGKENLTDKEKEKPRQKANKNQHQSLKVMELFEALLRPSASKPALLYQQIELDNLMSFSTFLWITKILINNTLIYFVGWLIVCKFIELAGRPSKHFR